MSNVLVIGAGKSGVAAANYLARRGSSVVISDPKEEALLLLASELDPSVRTAFGEQHANFPEGIDLVVLSPGVPPGVPLVKEARSHAIPVISEIELAFREIDGTVIAITGSNGKSTTTALTGEILRAAGREAIVAGNIGQPLVSAVERGPHDYVIELSSFQLEAVDEFRADVAVLLNITPDHMDRYATLEDYAAAKYRIFRNQKSSDVAIVNADDPRTAEPETPAKVRGFSSTRKLEQGAFIDGDDLVLAVEGRRERIARSALLIPGIANLENALASWLAADAAGVGPESVERAFRSFRGLPHRMAVVRDLNGVRYINDSKGTNVDATLKSLEGLDDGRVFLILGGKDKNGEFERMRKLMATKARAVLTIGSAAERIAEALEGVGEIVNSRTMDEAVRYVHEHAADGDTVLLSPACASFDQYENFEHRGRHFEELVHAL